MQREAPRQMPAGDLRRLPPTTGDPDGLFGWHSNHAPDGVDSAAKFACMPANACGGAVPGRCGRKQLAVTYCTKADDKLRSSYHGFLAVVFVAAQVQPLAPRFGSRCR
jgi:hypothetical protein